ncbi:Protein alcS [Colletotrichum tanaceti]|nr:Protein alcS [Colletotrichum tanaceti]
MDHKDQMQEIRSLSYLNEPRRPEYRPDERPDYRQEYRQDYQQDQRHGVPNGYEYPEEEYIAPQSGRDDTLQTVKTAGSVSMSPELFEKLYLSPLNNVKGDLRKTFGNPTPIAIVGFLISLTPLSCDLMGWRGATTSGAAGM